MEELLVMIPVFVIFIIYIMLIGFYFALIGFIIWFIISFLRRQKERNMILQEISNKLNTEEIAHKKRSKANESVQDENKNRGD